MKQVNTRGWTYIINEEAIENKQAIKEECENTLHGTVGKYLFFSCNKQELINLCEVILKEFNLSHGKVPQDYTPNNYVLCVYDVKPRYSKELTKFATDTIKYRYWKADAKTMQGVYST